MNNKTTENKEQKELRELMQKINNCWYKGNPLQLSDFFHPDVVFNSPDLKYQIIGNENCVKTYIDFINNSEILLYSESNHGITLFANTAVVTYDYEIKYKQNNRTYHETGTDIFVFERYQDSWKVIWRGVSNLKNIQ